MVARRWPWVVRRERVASHKSQVTGFERAASKAARHGPRQRRDVLLSPTSRLQRRLAGRKLERTLESYRMMTEAAVRRPATIAKYYLARESARDIRSR